MIKVFFSYSHKDSAQRDELEVHLSPLKREGVISTWHDRDIDAGSDFSGSINSNLEDADVILLLISPYFLASDYCHDIEMKRAIERHEAGEARVIPLILESCDWKHSLFGHLLALPTDGKPVSKHENYHDAFLQVATELRKIGGKNESPSCKTPESLTSPRQASESNIIRTSNLRVSRELTDRSRDAFRNDAFEFIAKFFENSLAELERRNSGLHTSFRRIDANSFSSVIYIDERKETACSIVLGGSMGDISYSSNESAPRNSCNEWLSVHHDGYITSLKTSGMSHVNSSDTPLTMQGAAEYFWEILIEPLQYQRK